VGQGLERSVADLPGGPQVQEGMELAWQKAEQKNVPAALQMGVDLLAPGMHELAMIPVFHGSGARFPAFDFGKIGTGEGTQAFSYGLYFAQNPKVARTYARAGAAQNGNFLVDGAKFDPEIPRHASAQWIDWEQRTAAKMQRAKLPSERKALTRDKLIERAIAERREVLDEIREMDELKYELGYEPLRSAYENYAKQADELDDTIAMLKSDAELPKYEAPEGMIYDVELDFDHEDLLDWDIAIEDMPAGVQEKLAKVAEDHGMIAGPKLTGERFYRRLQANYERGDINGEIEASQRLLEAGIPGTRFLDAESRKITRGRSPMGLRREDGTRYRTRGQTERDVAAGATNAGGLDEFIRMTEGTLSRYEGAKLSNGMAVSDQAIGDLQARLNVARRMRTEGANVGELPLTRNIVAFSDEGIEILNVTPEKLFKAEMP
jgi:hypothetical protein